jgi:hypothetical protein
MRLQNKLMFKIPLVKLLKRLALLLGIRVDDFDMLRVSHKRFLNELIRSK